MRNAVAAAAVLVCLCSAALGQTLTPNVPDIPQCHGILSQAIVDRASQAQTDPAADFEQWRRSKRTMMEAPPHIECQSKLWRALQHSKGLFNLATVPTATRGIGLQPSDPASEMHIVQYATSVGSNVDPGGGVTAYQGEVQMAVNENNGQQLVAGSNTFYQDADPTCASPTGGVAHTYGTQALFGSTDGGATWTYRCAPWPSTLTGGAGGYYYYGSDPAVAWDANGNAYAAYMLLADGSLVTTAIVVAKSTDSGSTWTSLGTVVDHLSNSGAFDDKEMIAVDRTAGPASSRSHPGRLYVIWDTNNSERVAHSDDGVTWTTVVLPTPSFGQYDIGGDVVVGPDGTVYAIWNRLIYPSGQTGERIVFSASTDGGNTWSAPVTVASTALLSFGNNNMPPAQNDRGLNSFGSIGVDTNPASPYYGYLYVAYNDFPSGTASGTDVNVYVVTSTNGGVSWSTPVKANDDSGTATQFFPWLSVDATDGSVNVSWYDTRNDPSAQKTQIYYARSVNGGISFEPNILITDNGANGWRNQVSYSNENYPANGYSNVNQYGDYAGIVAFNRQVHPVWADSRQFFPTGDTQTPSRLEDMATAAIINCSAPDTPATPTIVAACGSGVVQISWSAVSNWGTNATGGSYSVFRSTSATLAANATPIASGLTGTTYTDTTGTPGGVYYYFVGARNNCSGTTLTAMTAPSPASAQVIFPSSTSNCAGVTGTVTVGSNRVAGATVSGGGNSTTTDATGIYRLYGLAPGTYSVTASATGYASTTVNNITVTNNAYVTQDFILGIDPAPGCLTDTTQSDFAAGTGSNIDTSTSAGDVRLAPSTAVDQQQTSAATAAFTVSTTSWVAQSFVAGATGALTSVDLSMLLSHATGGSVTVEIRNDNAGKPGSVLATTAIPAFANASATPVTATFTAPAIVTSGTTYHVVVAEALGSGDYGIMAACGSSCDPYANGTALLSTDSGSTWNAQTTDLYFKTRITTYAASGSLTSTAKDSNPVLGADTNWTTLSWTAATPAGTTVKFQAAASNAAIGPFNFVGPDGTASTYFTSTGASLAQFNGNQYLATKAFLSTSDPSVTPALNDVTACYSAVACSTPPTPSISTSGSPDICTGASVTLTSSSASGNQWYRNGVAIAGATGITYVASSAAAYTVVVTLKGCSSSTSAPVNVTINAFPSATITKDASSVCALSTAHTASVPDAGAGATYSWTLTNATVTSGAGTRSITWTASSTSPVTLSATVTSAFGCTTTGSATVTVIPFPSTPTISTSSTSWCSTGYYSIYASATYATSYQWYLNGNPLTGQTYASLYVYNPTQANAGTYTVVATNSCGQSAASAGVTVTVTTMDVTVTASGPTTFCQGLSVTLTAPAGTGYTYLWSNGATTQSIVVTTSGAYNVRVSTPSGCSAYSAYTNVTALATTAPTITPYGPTSFCSGASVNLAATVGYSSYVWSTGETTQMINVTKSGNYTVTVTNSSGCKSTSVATTVTVWSPDATITPSGPTTFCAPGSVTLNAVPGMSSYAWMTNSFIVGTESSIKVWGTGSYTVRVTDAHGCTSYSAPMQVTMIPNPPTPTINASGPTTFCQGGSVTLTATVSIADTYTFLWSTGATTSSINVTTPGSYTVTITSKNGCTSLSYPTVVTVNSPPPTPTLKANGPTTYCSSGQATLLSASATNGQWYRDGFLLQGVTTGNYSSYVSGTYTFATVTACGTSAQSNPITITVLNTPPQPAISGAPWSGGPYCPGNTFTLNSNATSGNQWFKDGVAIPGATATTYTVTGGGSYTVQTTSGGCTSPMSAPTVLAYLPTPSVSPNGTINVCPGASVKLSANIANGYQWYLDGKAITGATASTYTATKAGNYTVLENLSNTCSVMSAAVTLSTAGAPNATISAPGNVLTGATASASVADAGAGATYNWTVINGTIQSGAATRTLSFVAGSPGNCTLTATVTSPSGCSDTKGITVKVNAPLQILTVSPPAGPPAGGTSVSLTGTGFVSGASVAFGGVAASNVTVVNASSITATLPPHALGAVDVVVTNPDSNTFTMKSSFTYRQQQFDPNGDSVIDPSDVFYLVNYLFTNGPVPSGPAGKVGSGDANGDGVVDPSDIFYIVNYLFTSGPAPLSVPSLQPRRATSVSGSISLGNATLRDGKLIIPVVVDARGARTVSLKLLADGDVASIAIRRTTPSQSTFETTRQSDGAVSWLASFADPINGPIAEIEIVPRGDAAIALDFDRDLTTLGNREGTAEATAGNGQLTIRGTTINHHTIETPRTHE